MGWILPSPDWRRPRSASGPAHCDSPSGGRAGVVLSLRIIFLRHWCLPVDNSGTVQISGLGLGRVRWRHYTRARDFGLGRVAVVGIVVLGPCRRSFAGVARLVLCHVCVGSPQGATVGSVIPTRGAIIPAAVGAELACGMMAV